jgi:hypothetical protein
MKLILHSSIKVKKETLQKSDFSSIDCRRKSLFRVASLLTAAAAADVRCYYYHK